MMIGMSENDTHLVQRKYLNNIPTELQNVSDMADIYVKKYQKVGVKKIVGIQNR